jgi:hypothetical protein
MISIDWLAKVIHVPRADMALVQASPEIRELDINNFRLVLKDLEDDETGMAFPRTHNHNPEVAIAGITLARVVEILPPYSVTFEDGQYAVSLTGANNNVPDVVNVNQVSVRSNNSAGLTNPITPAVTLALADTAAKAVWGVMLDNGLSALQIIRLIASVQLGKSVMIGNSVLFRDLADTKTRIEAIMAKESRTNIIVDPD